MPESSPSETVQEEIITDYHQEIPLWDLGIKEIVGRNLETKGRDDVNELLQSGWILLHIYTLKYKEDSVWRERPMAILGRPEQVKPIQEPH